MYFWMLTSNIFPEFLYHPHLLRCIRLCESTSLHMLVTGGLYEVVWTCCNEQSCVIHVWLTVLCRLLARAQCVVISEGQNVCSTINMPRKSINSSYAFCYICDEVTFKSWRRYFTPLIKKCYEHYFGCKVGNQDKSWAPHFCCMTCARLLTAWEKCSRSMSFVIPIVWREPTDHVSDCYFCLTSVTGVIAKSTQTVQYPNLTSARRPIPHSAELPVPKPPANMMLSDSESSDEDVDQANNNMEGSVMFWNDVCSIMQVLGHEYNPDQWHLFIDSSKVAWRWFYSTTEIDTPLFLWLMLPTWRKVMKAWSYCWECLSGSYVVISRLWHCYSECKSGTQNTAVSCANRTAGTRRVTM